MSEQFFRQPILNSPYGYPGKHWELDGSGQPTQNIAEQRRRAEFVTPIPKAKKQAAKAKQASLIYGEVSGLSDGSQRYVHNALINDLRHEVDAWRELKNPADWKVSPETQRLLQHWRHHDFSGGPRPFFCQIEAVETAIWLAEVAPSRGKIGQHFLDHLDNASAEAWARARKTDPGLHLKLTHQVG